MLANKRVLVCSKNRLTLTAVSLAEPILQSLIGGATTEDEALQIQLESNPDLLITSEDLERGYGIRLVEKAKQQSPDLKALIFLSRETPEVVQEAMEAGADGVMFVSSIGTGDGDFIMLYAQPTVGVFTIRGLYLKQQPQKLNQLRFL